MSRFAPPSLSDEYRHCNNCDRKLHFEALNDEGLCQECEPEKEDEEDE